MFEPRFFTGQVKVTERPDEISIYPTVTGVAVSSEEFIMHFAERGISEPGSAMGILKVYLSPTHAKRLALTLGKTVHDYEEAFGEIVIDPARRLTAKGREQFHIDDAKSKG